MSPCDMGAQGLVDDLVICLQRQDVFLPTEFVTSIGVNSGGLFQTSKEIEKGHCAVGKKDSALQMYNECQKVNILRLCPARHRERPDPPVPEVDFQYRARKGSSRGFLQDPHLNTDRIRFGNV